MLIKKIRGKRGGGEGGGGLERGKHAGNHQFPLFKHITT